MTHQLSEAEVQQLDALIDQQHEALGRAEAEAVTILQRIAKVPGCEGWTRIRRHYAEVRNPWAPEMSNLTVQQAILRHDPALASFLAAKAGAALPGVDPGAAEREQRKQQSIAAMQEETQRLRQQRQEREQRQVHERIHGRWHPVERRWV